MGCLPQIALGLERLSDVGDAVALQQIKERGALPMIDRGDIRQAIDRCSNIWASLPGAGYGQFEHKADSLIAKFKSGQGGTVREIDKKESRVIAIISVSTFASSACHGLLIITVITPLPTKPSATKMPENWKLPACTVEQQMRQRDVAALDAKYTKELADAKAEK